MLLLSWKWHTRNSKYGYVSVRRWVEEEGYKGVYTCCPITRYHHYLVFSWLAEIGASTKTRTVWLGRCCDDTTLNVNSFHEQTTVNYWQNVVLVVYKNPTTTTPSTSYKSVCSALRKQAEDPSLPIFASRFRWMNTFAVVFYLDC